MKWAKKLYDGEAMSKPYLQDLLELAEYDQDKAHYGLGVSISQSEFGTTYGHDGWFPGYRSKVSYYPDFKIAIAIQVNSDVEVDLGQYMNQLTSVLLASKSE